MSEAGREIVVEVAYARPEAQRIVQLRVPEGTTLREAVEPDPRKGDAIPSTKGSL